MLTKIVDAIVAFFEPPFIVNGLDARDVGLAGYYIDWYF